MLPFYLLSLIVSVNAELLPGSCSFDKSICGYTSDPAFLSWTLDTTGHFITVDMQTQEPQGKAVLLGPDVDQQDWSCFRMVYQVTGNASLQVQKRTDGDSFDHVLWTTQSPSDSWLIANIDLQKSTEPYQIIIESKLREGSSVSIFEIKISDKYCIGERTECDFEEPHLCGYTNQRNRYMNWRLGRADETTHEDRTGQYMYVDSTDTKSFHEVAKLVSPMTTVPMSGCLSFQYQQHHSGGHLFSLFSRDQAGQYQELWRADLPENNHVDWNPETKVWIPVQVDLKAPYPIELVFEVEFNSQHGGYVVLDDITFSPEFCNAGTEPTFDPSVANCDFESGYCQYTQTLTDGPLWRRVSVRPNIYSTGDHTTGAGSFLLANSRFSSQSGYVSRLFGPLMPRNQKYCVKFFYSLRGLSSTDQVLAVYLYYTDGSKQETLWIQNEKIRNVWIEVELTVQSQKNAQMVFISTCKNVWSCGSVGLDDIKVNLGDCLPLASPLSVPSQCDFEAGFCGYSQDKEDTGDWMMARGPTPTSYTGPRGDHTTGVGHYLHIEASLMLPGNKARLLSSSLRPSREPQCLQFYFHMYGSGTGQLSVYLLQTGQENEDKLLWTRYGEQGVSWLRASITYQHDQEHKIVFEATRGASVRSDIAIDDVVFERGPCKESAVDHIPAGSPSGNNINDIL